MTYTSYCECDECGSDIDNDDRTYCERCFEEHQPSAQCTKCKQEIEKPSDEIVYCEECWEKHCRPLNEQLADMMESLYEAMNELPGNFQKVTDQYKSGEKNLDAVYAKMAKVQEGFKKLQEEFLQIRSEGTVDPTAKEPTEPGLKDLFEEKKE
jgi:hypothetical protein